MTFEENYAGKLKEVEQMNISELEDFEMYLDSLLDNPTKCYFLEAIQKRRKEIMPFISGFEVEA